MFTLRAKLAATALGLALMAGPAAHATTVLSDNFDGENGGASALNYTGFSQWTSTGAGYVDLVRTPNYGITCAGGGGSCVDLDGSPGPGEITSIQSFAYGAGQKVTLSFDVSGNQRDSQTDNLYAGFELSVNTAMNNYTYGGGFGSINIGNLFGAGATTGGDIVAGNQPWTHYSLSWTAGNAGLVRVLFGSTSADNIGPLLDNVNLSIGAGTPEPATWALMLGGFGLAGAALRRRKAALA